MVPIRSNLIKIIGFFCGVLVLCVLVYFRPSIITDVKDFFSRGQGLLALRSIQKEIFDSGKLIAGFDAPNSLLTQQGVYTFTNTERTTRQMKMLGSNAKLDQVAEIRMKDMFSNQYFEHVSPNGNSASKEADVVQYEYITLGENIALGNFKDDKALVDAWMNSPGHRANILNKKFTEIGIAVGKGTYEGRKTWIAVQVFGKPLNACPMIREDMKQSISEKENRIEALQRDLNNKKQTLDSVRNNGASQSDYNEQVDAYNSEVAEVNTLIASVKTDIEVYNGVVQAFNLCLSGTP